MLEEFNTVTTSCLSMLSPLSSSSSSSASFTRPPPFEGNIIEAMPSSVWAEDEHWSEERVAAAQERLALQGKPLSSFFRDKFTLQADKFWRAFYVRNLNRFYKDRHYLHHIFPDLQREGHSVVVEVGCGVGNAALPLLEVNPSLRIVAIDFAESAINFLKANYSHETRLQAHVCDVVKDCLPIAQSSADFVLCFFVLSAIAPEFHSLVATKLLSVLKPGGKVLLRDYGRYDEAQLRFGKGKKLEENFYVRQDGTCAYYFTTDELRHIFTSHRHHHDADNSDDSSNGEGNGPPMVRTERCEYVLRQQANRKLQQARYRVWVEAVFVKER